MVASLTPRQARFVAEYLVDLNATQAARRAGYSEHTAQQQGTRLLSNALVRSAIERAKAERSTRLEVTQDRVVLELARLAFADARDYFEWGPEGVKVKPSSDLSDDQAAAVAEVSQTVTAEGGTIRVKLADKQAALTLLAKHTGGFVERQEHTGKDGAPLAPALVVVPATAEDLDEWRRRHGSKT